MTRTPCGHAPGKRARFLYFEPGDRTVVLCGRDECERAYNGTEGAMQSRNAEATLGQSEKCCPHVGERELAKAGPVDAGLAQPLQRAMFEGV